MSIFGKLIGLATIGNAWINVRLLQYFMSTLIGIIAMIIVAAVMGSIVLIGTFVAAYFSLVRYGLDPMIAAVAVTSTALSLTLILIGITLFRLQHLRQLHHAMQRDTGTITRVGNLAISFLEGLSGTTRRQRS